jgi:transaldolase
MPEKTMRAFADHGELRGDQVTTKYDDAQQVMDDLKELGIDYDDVIETLEREGVDKFVKSWSELSETVAAQMASSDR